MPTAEESAKTTRMSGAARRELILEAAARAFARGGYAGTSTDAVAREARVSQPYVVRLFGGKAALFREVFSRSLDRILEAFGEAAAALPVAPGTEWGPQEWASMGSAYADLLADRDLLLVMLHGFAAGGDTEIGAQARASMSAIYTFVRTTASCTPERARDFIAQGMLVNTMLAIDATGHVDEDPALGELTSCAIGNRLDAAGTP